MRPCPRLLILRREDLECSVELWGDEPPTLLYHLLFVSEGEVPWRDAMR